MANRYLVRALKKTDLKHKNVCETQRSKSSQFETLKLHIHAHTHLSVGVDSGLQKSTAERGPSFTSPFFKPFDTLQDTELTLALPQDTWCGYLICQSGLISYKLLDKCIRTCKAEALLFLFSQSLYIGVERGAGGSFTMPVVTPFRPRDSTGWDLTLSQYCAPKGSSLIRLYYIFNIVYFMYFTLLNYCIGGNIFCF